MGLLMQKNLEIVKCCSIYMKQIGIFATQWYEDES